jgi:hypothetical protein
MSYLEKFIEAIKYRNELFQELFPVEKNLDVEVYKSNSSSENITKKDLNDFKETSLDFLSYILNNEGINPTSNCHSISECFKQYLHKYTIHNDNEISVTIGDVSFRDEKLYDINKEKLRHILKEGQKDSPLDVHTWITYKSIYIFDPVIKFNLSFRGLLKLPGFSHSPDRMLIAQPDYRFEDCLLSWDDSNKQEIDYHPLLVDNGFFHRVDHFQRRFL